MNLRDIKKDIDYVLSAFVEDCATCVAVNPKVGDEAVAALMEEAIDLYNELRDKAAAKKVEGNKKAFYNALRKEILERTDALYSKLSAVVAGKEVELKTPKEEPVKKAAAKKPAAKKAEPKEEAPAAEKPAAKKPSAKKPAAPKTEAEKAEKPAEKKPAAKKAAAPKAEKSAAEKKPAAKKAPAKKAE